MGMIRFLVEDGDGGGLEGWKVGEWSVVEGWQVGVGAGKLWGCNEDKGLDGSFNPFPLSFFFL